MPLPKPKGEESKDDFLKRCMSDDKTKEEFPKTDQRMAVCLQQWKDE